MKVVLISLYDLGHQPFGLASPAAWLRARGHTVTCGDAAVEALPREQIAEADVVAVYLPMHTAARMAAQAAGYVRGVNTRCRLIAYGLYAPINADYLKSIGFTAVIGGEYEQALCDAVEGNPFPILPLDRLAFTTPDRAGLPALARYSKLHSDTAGGGVRLAGYTEASRGCKHLCRHCPVVPVYNGTFRVVPVEVVLADIRQQVEIGGARHITFGDPDFFNGPGHAMRVVKELHREFSGLSYDVTIKVEHLLRNRSLVAELRATGCVLVTSAVESVDERILTLLDKHHTRAEFEEAVAVCRDAELALAPTFVAFTPWTTREGYRELLQAIRVLGLVEAVAPIQLALRLLLPPGSRLLDLEETREHVTGFDASALLHRWQHPDPWMDELAAKVLRLVAAEQKRGKSRREIFAQVWSLACGDEMQSEDFDLMPRATVPYLDEPWYC